MLSDITSKVPQALVLVPTPGSWLRRWPGVRRYGAYLSQLNVLPIYGGSSYAVQLAGLRRGAQVLVGTPVV